MVKTSDHCLPCYGLIELSLHLMLHILHHMNAVYISDFFFSFLSVCTLDSKMCSGSHFTSLCKITSGLNIWHCFYPLIAYDVEVDAEHQLDHIASEEGHAVYMLHHFILPVM